MNCDHFAVIVHELARPDSFAESLDEAAREAAQVHARECGACAAKLAEAQLLALALDATAADSEQFEAPEELQDSLLARYREYHRLRLEAEEQMRRPKSPARRRWLEWGALASAAVLLFAAGVWNHAHQVPARKMPRTSVVQTEAPSNPNEANTADAEDAANGPMADFVPVPFADSLGPGDSAFVVRVQMPRSALSDLGYPLDLTHSADMVEADLLVGEDGLPRAVRLVH